MITDTTQDTGPTTPRQACPELRRRARDSAGSRRDAEPAADKPNEAPAYLGRDTEESLRSFNEALDELWSNTVAIQMEQMERTVQQIGLRYSLPAWLPDRLAWWLAKRWPAEWLPTLDRRRVGPARQDHEH